MKTIMLKLVRFYQLFISPLMGPSCRFYPTCSAYAVEAINKHGSLKGSWLAGKRICRCHPFSAGGYDPVPPTEDELKQSCKNGCSHSSNDHRDPD